MSTSAYTDCPQPEVLQEIAAEVRTPDLADLVLKHTAQCDHCGPLLNRYLQEFSDEHSSEIKAMLASLPSTQPKNQKDLAHKLAAQARGEKQPSKPAIAVMPWPFWKKAVAWATPLAAVVLVVIGVGPTLKSRYELYSVNSDVKQAYLEQRTTEMQLPGMPYGKYVKPNRTLGAHDIDSDAPALLSAKGALNEHVKAGKPLDTNWLEVQGRVYLLQGSPDKAEKALKNALVGAADSAPIMIDLAASYYERGDYAKAIDTLVSVNENAGAADRDRTTALFNLGVVYQRAEMWDMASDTWKKFLAKQSSGQWADEARARLAAAEQKLQWHKQQGQNTLSDPAKFVAGLESATVQQNAEEYINTALIRWIPQSTQSPPNDFFFGGPEAG